jgi:hypothetical protein
VSKDGIRPESRSNSMDGLSKTGVSLFREARISSIGMADVLRASAVGTGGERARAMGG